jgi:hypothetical protein
MKYGFELKICKNPSIGLIGTIPVNACADIAAGRLILALFEKKCLRDPKKV